MEICKYNGTDPVENVAFNLPYLIVHQVGDDGATLKWMNAALL